LSTSPSFRRSPPREIDPFKTTRSQSSLNATTRYAGISFTDSLKKLTRRAKATPADAEASPSIKITISGPSRYVPDIGSGWSPNDYLTLHNVTPIENPLIEHPAIGPQQFGKDVNRHAENDEEDSSMTISHKMRQLDKNHGHKTRCKVRSTGKPPSDTGRIAIEGLAELMDKNSSF
jgi:hypothetical protein